jgi:hypothetical protein
MTTIPTPKPGAPMDMNRTGFALDQAAPIAAFRSATLQKTLKLRLKLLLSWLIPTPTFLAISLALAICSFGAGQAQATTYYSKSSNTSPQTLANWNSNRDGTSGSTPANFTTSGDVFVFQGTGGGSGAPHTVTGTAAWTVTGTVQTENGATLNQGDGTTSSASVLFTFGTFQIDNGGTYNVNYKHGTSGSATSIPGTTRSFGASSTVEIKLWGDGTGTSPSALPSGVTWGNLKINVPTLAGSWAQAGALTTVNGNLTIAATGGTTREFRLNANSPATSTLTIGGDLIISGGIFNITSGTAIETLNIGGNFNQSGGTFTATGSGPHLVYFTGGSASVTFAQSAGTFTDTAMNFQVASPKTLTLNNTLTLAASRTLVVDSGAKLATSATLTIGTSGTATINGAFQLNQGGFGTGGTWTYGPSGTLIYNNSSGVYGPIDSGHAYWPSASGPVNVTVQGAGGINLGVSRTVTGILQTAAGVQGTALTLNGSAQINGGGFFSTAPIYGASSTLIYNTGGTYGKSTEWSADSGTIGSTAGYPNNVQISGNTTLNYPNGASYGARAINGSLTIDSGSSFYMDYGSPAGNGALTVPGNVSIAGNLSLGNVAPGDLVVKGNWTRTGTFTPNNRTVQFNGSSVQSITGATTFDFFRMNNAAGLNLNSSITVNQTLTLTSGLITTTGANLLTLGSTGSFASGSSSSYVNGPLAMTYTATGSKTFPIGKNGNYRPLSLNYTALSGTSTVTAEQTDPGSGFGGGFANVTVFSSRYWTVTQSGGSSFTYNLMVDGTGFTPSGNAVVLKYNNPTTTKLATTFSAPNYTVSGLTSFSDFALGSETCNAATAATPTASPSATVCAGSSITLTETPSAGTAPLIYQWKKGGSNISGATSSTYTISTPTTADSGNYTCDVTAQCGGGTSTSPQLAVTVNDIPATSAISGSSNVCSGQLGVNYSVTLTSGSSYSWTAPSGASITAGASGPNNNQITVTFGSTGGVVAVTETNSSGCAGSQVTKTVTVNALPAISSSTGDQTVCVNTPATYSVTATGDGLTYQWNLNGSPLSNGGKYANVTTATLTVTPTSAGDTVGAANGYDCTVSGTCSPSVTSTRRALTVSSGVSIDTQPTAQTACSGGNASFSVDASGASLSYNWRKRGSGWGNAWIFNDNGGVHFLSSSSEIDTGGKAWGLQQTTASGGAAEAIRSLPAILASGQVFSWDMDNKLIDNGGTVGISLQDSGGNNAFELYFVGGASNYSINDSSSGNRDTGFGYTSTGLHVDFRLTSATTYSVTIRRLSDSISVTLSGSVISNRTIDRVRFFDFQSGAGNNMYFNNLLVEGADDNAGNYTAWSGDLGQKALADSGIINGSTTATLTLSSLTTGQTGESYDVVVGSACGASAISSAAGLTVNATPSALTPGNDGPICSGSTLHLTANTVIGGTYAWTGPNGFTSSTQNPSITNATTDSSGTYHCTVTVNGCTSPDATTSATANETPSALTLGNNGPICSGTTLNLTANTVVGGTYAWTGPNSFTSSAQNPSITNATTAASGTYHCTVNVSGCPSPDATTSATVNETPAPLSLGNNGPVCSGTTLNLSANTVAGGTYAWTGPNSFTSSAQNPSIANTTTAASGTYHCTVTVGSCTSPDSTTSATVNATPATPTASNNGPVCEGTTLSLSTPNVSGGTFSWTGPNGFTSSTQNPTVSTNATIAMSGNYYVIVTVNGCTSDAGSTTATVSSVPGTPAAANNGPVCAGTTLSLSTPTVSGATYSWTGPNGFTSSNQNPIVSTSATTAMAGTYGVTVTIGGCPSVAGTTVASVTASPTITLGTTLMNAFPGQAAVSLPYTAATGADTYSIDFDSAANAAGFADVTDQVLPASPIVIPVGTTAKGTYSGTLTVKNSNSGCVSSAQAIQVAVVGSTQVVIAEIYGGGGNSGASYQNDFVVLYNRSCSSVDVNGWSVQQASAAGTSWTVVTLATSSKLIPPGGYFLVQGASGGAVGSVLPTPDATSGINMGIGSGKVALCTNNTALSGATPSSSAILDVIGWGATASLFEGAPASAASDNVRSVQRKSGGCTDTDFNSTDFSNTASANPRNSATAANTCGAAPATPTASNNGPICSGSTLTLSTPSLSGATYSWTGPNGFTSSAQNPTVSTSATTAMAGTYNVTVTLFGGCPSAPGTTTVIVNSASGVSLDNTAQSICSDGTATVTATRTGSATGGLWTSSSGNSAGFSSTTADSTTYTPSATDIAAGTVTLTFTTTGHTAPCTAASASDVVTINLASAANFTVNSTRNLSFKLPETNLLSHASGTGGVTLSSVSATTANGVSLTRSGGFIFYNSPVTNNDSFNYTVASVTGGCAATATISVNMVNPVGPGQISMPTNGVVTIKYFGIPGYSYVVQGATDVQGPWLPMSTNTAGNDGSWIFTDNSATNSQQYYRLTLP